MLNNFRPVPESNQEPEFFGSESVIKLWKFNLLTQTLKAARFLLNNFNDVI